MQQGSSKWIGRPSPAMVVAVIALVAALSGTAFAALGKNSVGPRQLKKAAVTTGKIANNAVNGAKVANGSLTGADINLKALGKVPAAEAADQAQNAGTLGGHAAACPTGTTLIRGLCFDSTENEEVADVKVAADRCAEKGGYLPTPLQLYSVRGVINLGTGIGNDHQLTDSYFSDAAGGTYSTLVIDGTGAITRQEVTSPGHYICVYNLIR